MTGLPCHCLFSPFMAICVLSLSHTPAPLPREMGRENTIYAATTLGIYAAKTLGMMHGRSYQNQNLRCHIVHLLCIPFAVNVPIRWRSSLDHMEAALRGQIPNFRLYHFDGFR